MAKRERHVFPTDEVPHLWAHKVQVDARNQQNNLFFEGDTIYSYRQSFPIARHVSNAKGKQAILFYSGGFSITTAGHQNQVKRSIPPSVPVFTVPSIVPSWGVPVDHDKNISHYLRESKQTFDKAIRSRGNGAWLLDSALASMAECKAYCKFFALPSVPFPHIPTKTKLAALRVRFEQDKVKAEASHAKAWNTKRAKNEERHAIRQREWEERLATATLELPAKIAAWREGKSVHFVNDATLLRIINADTVQTSRGASIPLDHAARGYKVIKAVMRAGREWKRNGHTLHLGHYSMDRIEPNGTLYAGCHIIEWPEIELIGRAIEGRVDQSELLLCEV